MAIDTSERVRERSLELNVGYDKETDLWEVILQYTGDLDLIRRELNIEIDELLGGYGIARLKEEQIRLLSDYPQIDYIEKPKSLFLQEMEGVKASCVWRNDYGEMKLTGKDVITVCIDSGVDIYHPDFRNKDGSTRILTYWDQTIEGNSPKGYQIGTEYTKEEIDAYLFNGQEFPSRDISGHGTAVLGIMSGNGNASEGFNKGMAPEADIIVVKMLSSFNKGFPRTTQLMMGIDFSVRRAIAIGKPLVINISFGNNYGAHNGESIIERYIDKVSSLYKISIVAGSGNDGLSGRHAEGRLTYSSYVQNEEKVELVVENYLTAFNLQIWKSYLDQFLLWIELPNLVRVGPFTSYNQIENYIVNGNRISVLYGEPTPYNSKQEIYLSITNEDNYIMAGIWKLIMVPTKVVDGRYSMWLPVDGSTSAQIYFLNPSLSNTLVIPSTARGTITVSAYNSYTGIYAGFSGRGSSVYSLLGKPDLCAPGVLINTCSVGGGYTTVTGTSFGTPFVAGACALLMEYGIVNKMDPYLYGEKMRAVLIGGAIPLEGQNEVPDALVGYGRLCLQNSLNQIKNG